MDERLLDVENKLDSYQLDYNWNNSILPGTLVCAKYKTFDGKDAVGIFCVIYDEQLDGNVEGEKNVTALKVTSQLSSMSLYSVIAQTAKNPFLKMDCMINCSKLHTLHKRLEIYKLIGQLDSRTYARVVKTYAKFSSNITKQLLDRI